MLLMYILVDIFKGSKDARKSGELVSHQRVEESRSLANLAFVIDPLVFVGLLVFTLLAALGNFFFGRKR